MAANLENVTITIDPANDMAAAGFPAAEAEDFARAYREAAAAICDGFAVVRVLEVADGGHIGCDAAWAADYGLWQAVHDCCRRREGRWAVAGVAVERVRAALESWVAREWRPKSFQPTHRITLPGGVTEAVMVVDGAAYTQAEWESASPADYERSDCGVWTFQGQPFAGNVAEIV